MGDNGVALFLIYFFLFFIILSFIWYATAPVIVIEVPPTNSIDESKDKPLIKTQKPRIKL